MGCSQIAQRADEKNVFVLFKLCRNGVNIRYIIDIQAETALLLVKGRFPVMTQTSNDPQKVAESAMEFELEGRRILSEAGEKAKDPLSKATFKFLADQELKHIEAIKAYAKSLNEEGDFDMSKMETALTKKAALRSIKGIFDEFQTPFEIAAAEDDSRLDVYQVAMDMEDHGHDFYKSAAAHASDPVAKKFYSFLAAEEVNHFEIIQETYTFLNQPDAFQAIDEHWMTL